MRWKKSVLLARKCLIRLSTYFRNTRTECIIFERCVAEAEWPYPKQDMESSIAHALFEQENKTVRCACALREELTSCTGSWPSLIVQSIVWNTSGRALPTRVKFATRAVVSSSARLEYGPCCELHTLVWNRPHPALVTQYTIIWQVIGA